MYPLGSSDAWGGCERKGALLSPPRSPSTLHRGPCQGKQAQVLTQALRLFAGEEGAGSQDKLGPEGRALPAPSEPSSLGGPPGAQSRDSALTVRPQPGTGGPGAWGALMALPWAVRRAGPSPTLSSPGIRDHQGTGRPVLRPWSPQHWTRRPQTVLAHQDLTPASSHSGG